MLESIMPNEKMNSYPLAMAYVPWQHITSVYEKPEEAYTNGSLFPELTKPFTGRSQKNGK